MKQLATISSIDLVQQEVGTRDCKYWKTEGSNKYSKFKWDSFETLFNKDNQFHASVSRH